jgi:hypothetical protein
MAIYCLHKKISMKKIILVTGILLSFSFVFTSCNNSTNKETTSTSTDSKETLAKDVFCAGNKLPCGYK